MDTAADGAVVQQEDGPDADVVVGLHRQLVGSLEDSVVRRPTDEETVPIPVASIVAVDVMPIPFRPLSQNSAPALAPPAHRRRRHAQRRLVAIDMAVSSTDHPVDRFDELDMSVG